MTQRPRRRAISLIEMTMVLGGLMFFMGLLGTTLLGTLQIYRTGEDKFQKMLARSTLADQFRADVAGATQVLETWQDFTTGKNCLILCRPSEPGRDSVVVYHWHDQVLERVDFAGAEKHVQTFASATEHADVAFQSSAGMCMLRLTSKSQPGTHPIPFEMDFSAALRGELR